MKKASNNFIKALFNIFSKPYKYISSIFSNFKFIKIVIDISVLIFLFFILDLMEVWDFLVLEKNKILVITGVTLFVIFIIYLLKPTKNLISRSIGYLDYYNFILFIFCFISLILYNQLYILTPFEFEEKVFIIFVFILFFSLCIIIIRIFLFNTKNENKAASLYDLYLNNLNIANYELLFFDDKAVDYDLLGRGKIINKIIESVLSKKGDEKYVISIEGAWGSGKTTILKNVFRMMKFSNKSKHIIISEEDFDLWKYNDEISMFRAMFNIIVEKCEIGINPISLNKYLNDYIDQVFDSKKLKFFRLVNLYTKNEDDIMDLISQSG